jgi:hypothetical protein
VLSVKRETSLGNVHDWPSIVTCSLGTATFRSCDSGGATYHFCPECGSTVYWDISAAPDVIGVAVGAFTDPTFPPPMISGFEAYGHPWAMNASDLPVPHLDYDGTEGGGPRA